MQRSFFGYTFFTICKKNESNTVSECLELFLRSCDKDQGQHPRFGLRGTFLKHTSEEVMAGLKKVEYSSRFAVAYFFDKSKAGSITNNQIAELSNCLR